MANMFHTAKNFGYILHRPNTFKCSIDYAKRSFHRGANSIFWQDWQKSFLVYSNLLKGNVYGFYYTVLKHVPSKS